MSARVGHRARVRDAVRSRRSRSRGRGLPRRARAHRGARAAAARLQHRDRRTRARARRRASIASRARWRDAPLAGVPVALKDNLCTRGVRTTASSRILETFVPPYDATVGRRGSKRPARSSSARPTATSSRWARRPRTRRSARRAIRGRSIGSRADRAADRPSPSRPAWRRSRSAPTPADRSASRRRSAASSASSRPTAASRATACSRSARRSIRSGRSPRTVARRRARAVGASPAPIPRDATSARRAGARLRGGARRRRPRRCASACPARCSTTASTPKCRAAFETALERCARAARRWSTSSCRTPAHAIPVYYLVATAEASSNLARYDGVRYGFRAAGDRARARRPADDVRADAGAGLRRRGQAPHHARHLRAERRLLRRVLPEGAAGAHADPPRLRAARSSSVDVVAMPTSPTPAFRLGERVDDPLQMYLADVFTVSANLAGLPAISVPCGFTADGLPIGLQLTGRPFDEATLLRIADAYERETDMVDSRRRRSEPLVRVLTGPSLARREAARGPACAISGCRSTAPSSSSGSRRSTPSSTRAAWSRPHYWLSDEWFTPDGVPGVAVPFYLAHPRLAKLELAQMLEVEGGDPEIVPEDPAPRGRPRDRQRVSAAPPADAAPALRPPDDAVPRVLHAEAVQQELRPAPRSLVRAEPSRRGLRRDVRGLARSAVDVGDAVRRLAGAAQARIHGSADARARAHERRRVTSKREVDPLPRLRKTLARALPQEARALRARPSRLLRERPAEPVLRRAGVREEPVGGPLRAAHPQGGPQHRGQLHRQLPVHDRSAAREDHRALPRAEPAAHRHPRRPPRSTSWSSSRSRR